MLTRCPHCSTTFRVQPEQLKARHGRVRCGHCQQVFDALESLLDMPVPIAVPVAATLPPAVAKETGAAPVDFGADVVQPSPTNRTATTDLAPAESDSALDEVAAEPAPSDVPDAGHPIPPASTLATNESEPNDAGTTRPDDGIANPDWAAAAFTRVDELHQPDEHAARSLWRAVVLAAGIGLALAALLLQATYVWRSTLALAMPETRPLLETACQRLGCTIELPSQPDLLSIESSDLHPEPGAAERLILVATLRNRAEHPQTWPHLELSLTDSADRAIVRKVFSPAEYVPYLRAGKLNEGIAAGTEAQLEMRFEIGKLAASGYRLYLFYP
jgi:predicted Zn finger-like uncharacterized protein